jgi:hypothetical protein
VSSTSTAGAPSALCLTLDLDWAPDHVLADTRELLREAGLPVTIFATHATPGVTEVCTLPACETGVHPNFLGAADEEAVLGRLLDAFPGAVGVRCHALFYHSRLLPLFHRRGVRYFSNDLMFLQPGLAPYFDWSGLVRLPIYWEDDVHCQYFDGRFDLAALRLDRPGLKVLNFHPVHLFLNTARLEDYQAAKPRLADPVAARAHRRSGPGIRSLFLEVTRGLRAGALSTLGQVAERFSTTNVFEGHTARRFAATAPGRGTP